MELPCRHGLFRCRDNPESFQTSEWLEHSSSPHQHFLPAFIYFPPLSMRYRGKSVWGFANVFLSHFSFQSEFGTRWKRNCRQTARMCYITVFAVSFRFLEVSTSDNGRVNQKKKENQSQYWPDSFSRFLEQWLHPSCGVVWIVLFRRTKTDRSPLFYVNESTDFVRFSWQQRFKINTEKLLKENILSKFIHSIARMLFMAQCVIWALICGLKNG